MPFGGPETVVLPPPLVAPPTGLIQSATVIEHALLESAGYLANMVGPDAPDSILASAVMGVAAKLFPDDITLEIVVADGALGFDPVAFGMSDSARKQIEALSFDQREALRLDIIDRAMVAAPTGGLEMGGTGDPSDPFDHWLAGIKWSPENVLAPELIDPCGDAGTASVDFAASGSTGISRKPNVAATPFVAQVHDSCSTWGWKEADYVGRATRGLAPKESWVVEREFMHGGFMGQRRTGTADTTNGNASIVAGAGTVFSAADVHRRITGPGIPANTFIGTFTNATHVVLSSSPTAQVNVNATATAAGVAIVIGGGSAIGVAAGGNRYLSDQNCHIYDLGAVDPTPIQALAYANEVIARANIGQGMIHVSAFFAEIVSALGFSFGTDARGRLRTLNGNIVVPGNGYDGVGPDGTGGSADDGSDDSGHTHEWIYVSDLPVIWRPPKASIFPATMREATRETLNEVTFRAQRPYIIAWSALLQTAIKCKII